MPEMGQMPLIRDERLLAGLHLVKATAIT